jgi:hypothetical protein
MVNHVSRLGYPTHNVIVVCDFDLRFTSVVVGWLGSVHDKIIFKDTLLKFYAIFSSCSSRYMIAFCTLHYVILVLYLLALTCVSFREILSN